MLEQPVEKLKLFKHPVPLKKVLLRAQTTKEKGILTLKIKKEIG